MYCVAACEVPPNSLPHRDAAQPSPEPFARREMAKRGELIVNAPIGYIKSEEPSLEKTADRRVREAIELLFEKVVEIGSVRQTLLWFQEHALQFTAYTPNREVQWKRPSYACFYRLLTKPPRQRSSTFALRRPSNSVRNERQGSTGIVVE